MDVVFWMSYTSSLATCFHGLSVRFILFSSCLFQLGGGYLFGLPVGFVADSIGATIGATAAFILGRTVSLLHTVTLWFLLHMCDMHAFFLLSLLLLFLFYFLYFLFFILKEIFEHGWMNIFLFELVSF